MCSFDPRELIRRSLEEGFTVNSISKATRISPELIIKYSGEEALTPAELQESEYLFVFATQLYVTDIRDKPYLESLVSALNIFFKVDNLAIETYMGLCNGQLDIFLQSPDSFPNGQLLSRKLTHLFTTFIRDRRHST